MESTIKVLVIDDLPHWAEIIRSYATVTDCEMRYATNLTAGVKELARWQPDVILLDLHMPRDKWQPLFELQMKYSPTQKALAFCEQVTAHPKLAHIVIVITSVEEQPEEQALGVAAGARYFFTKAEFSLDQFELLLDEARKLAQERPLPSTNPP